MCSLHFVQQPDGIPYLSPIAFEDVATQPPRTSAMAKVFSLFYLVGTPLLLLVSIPLALFAAFTTGIALSTLLIRVSIVYVELGVALLHSWISVDSHSQASFPVKSTPPSPDRSSPPRRKRRRSSVVSAFSSQEQLYPQLHSHPYLSQRRSGSSASLMFTNAPNRDFEGVGGWRNYENGEEEALWIGMNSRLELPTNAGETRRRNHHRSLTGGSQRNTWGPEMLRISPMQSRVRTPSASEGTSSPVEYFSLQPHAKLSTAIDVMTRKEEARKSLSGSSISSTSSRGSRTTIRRSS